MIKFSNLKIHEKLIISYLLLSLIPIAILGTTSIFYFKKFAMESTAKEIHNDLNSIRLKILEITNEAVNIANKLMIDQRLQELLSYKYKDPLEAYEKYTQYREIDNYKTLFNKSISRIKIYSENPTILENGVFFKVREDIKKLDWYKLANKLNGLIRWELIYESENIYPDYPYKGYHFSLVRLLKNVYNEKFGVLVININNLELQNILYHPDYEIFMVNDKNIIVAGAKEDYIGKHLNIDIVKTLDTYGSTIEYNRNKYQAFGAYIPLLGDNKDFYIIVLAPYNFIMSTPNRLQIFSLSIILLSILISSILIFIFSKNMSRRFLILTKAVNEISHGNWDLEISMEGRDEIAELSRNVNEMAKNIKRLIEEVYIANMQKNELLLRQKEMKLKLLSNQLNPHFLFNTLETIHMMAICQNQREIADIVLKLGNLLRRSIEFSEEVISLEEELKLVEDYLQIQKYRFGRLDYKIETYVDSKRVYILPFLIQPIVENSIIHGLEGKIEDNGFVKIVVKKEEENLVISIQDNGVGMKREDLEQLIKDINSESKKEIKVLKNIKERIRIYYGEIYGLHIESEKGKGTRVDIILPYQKVIKEEHYV